jgi:repressor LexA
MDAPLNDGDAIIVRYDNHILMRRYYRNSDESLITLKSDVNLLGREIFNKNQVCIVGKLKIKLTIY